MEVEHMVIRKRQRNRWCENYKKLPEHIRRRQHVEKIASVNCFSVQDCLDISKMCGVPVLDTHHFYCYSEINKTDPRNHWSIIFHRVLETWGDIKPKFHVSEQGAGKIGHHSDFIEEIPDELLEIPELLYDVDIDIMIEAKRKELNYFQVVL